MMQGLRGSVCAGCWYWSQLITTFPPKIDYSLTVSVWLPTIWATKKMSSPLPLPKDPKKKGTSSHMAWPKAQILLSHAWVLFMIYCEWRLVLTQLQALLVQNIIPNSIKYRNTKQREKTVSFCDFHLFLLLYFFLSRSTLLDINLLQLYSSIVVLDAPWLVPHTCYLHLFT